MFDSYNDTKIQYFVDEAHDVFSEIELNIIAIQSSFGVINFLSAMNFLYIIEHVVLIIFLNKLQRKYHFPDILHLTDTILAIVSGLGYY